MASTIQTPVAQAIQDLFTGNLGVLASKGLMKQKGRHYPYSVSSLFANNEIGVWYDPSDLTTLFQNSAGTTPVTAVDQPVGLILDKSKGLVLGAELVTNGGFDTDTAWTKVAGVTISGGVCNFAAVTSQTAAYQNSSIAASKSYRITMVVIVTSGTVGPLINGAPNVLGTTATVSGTYSWTLASGAANGNISINTSVFTGSVSSISVRELPGNHATQATAASRPILKQDANGKYYLLFDGVDDSLSTASIDFTSTDKMSVFAGVRKLSDAAAGTVAELSLSSNSNNGTFAMFAPGSVAPTLDFRSKGTSSVLVSATPFASPITVISTGTGDISGAVTTIRVNGTQAATSAASPGTGNYGNYPLYIGGRAGTSLPFNGHLYSLIVRGAQSTDAQIVSAESYVNSKTGAY